MISLVKTNRDKTGVINDPLVQTHIHASNKHCFLLFCFARLEKYVRTDNCAKTIIPTLFQFVSHCFAGCYRKRFGTKGYGYGQAGPALLSGDLEERLENDILAHRKNYHMSYVYNIWKLLMHFTTFYFIIYESLFIEPLNFIFWLRQFQFLHTNHKLWCRNLLPTAFYHHC